jgi:hypothetical protein
MRIIEIPGAAADSLGGNNLDAIATLRRAIIVTDSTSRYHAAKAYRPGDNVHNAKSVVFHAIAGGLLSEAAYVELRTACRENDAGAWLEAEGEAVATLIAAAEALLGAFGGDTPDYVREEAIALGKALDLVTGERDA